MILVVLLILIIAILIVFYFVNVYFDKKDDRQVRFQHYNSIVLNNNDGVFTKIKVVNTADDYKEANINIEDNKKSDESSKIYCVTIKYKDGNISTNIVSQRYKLKTGDYINVKTDKGVEEVEVIKGNFEVHNINEFKRLWIVDKPVISDESHGETELYVDVQFNNYYKVYTYIAPSDTILYTGDRVYISSRGIAKLVTIVRGTYVAPKKTDMHYVVLEIIEKDVLD